MENDILDLLEQRVYAMESKVFDKNGENPQNQVVTELLLQTHTMIASALSCRENIVSILERMPRLNDYLNPSYTDNEMELETRRQYVLELYPELKKTAELLRKFDKLRLFVDSPNITQMTDLSEKLDQLTISSLNIYEESSTVMNQVLQALQQYNDITLSIRVLFSEMDKSVSELEAALVPRVKMEE